MNNTGLKNIIRTAFIKGNLFGLMDEGFPEDEYVLEEGKIYKYIINKPNATQGDIYDELIRIIEDWFGVSPLHIKTLDTLKKMAEEIYIGIKKT